MRLGDKVSVYIPIGEEPYINDVRTIIGFGEDGTVHLDDNSSVHISFLTVITYEPPAQIGCIIPIWGNAVNKNLKEFIKWFNENYTVTKKR